MQLIEQTVVHKIFGKGTITALTDNTVTICFSQKEKKFIYPEAFVRFLTLKDDFAQKEIINMINKKNKEEKEQKQADREALDRIQELSNLKITPNSQAAFNIKTECKEEVFSSWTVSTGHYLSGYSKGSPRIPDRLKPNSVCLLTECPKGTTEKDRRIIGAFMVKETFVGSFCKDGLIEGHELYRVKLKEEEAPLFWDYFTKEEQLQRWGNTAFKYFTNVSIERILFDIRKSLCNSDKAEEVDAFYQHFCTINRLIPNNY
ncbi:MAG: hypothetical protein RSB37_05550 [Acetivibrio sp.]